MVSPALSRREKRDSGLHPNPVVTTNELPESLEITLFQAFFQSMSFHQNHGLDVFSEGEHVKGICLVGCITELFEQSKVPR